MKANQFQGTDQVIMSDGNICQTFILIQPINQGIGYATYELNNEFSRLTGLVGLGASDEYEYWLQDGIDYEFDYRIYVDDQLKYQQTFNIDYRLVDNIDINVFGGNILKIEVDAIDSNYCDLGIFANPTLSTCTGLRIS